MIHNQDRSGWFGASDTAKIMGNWNTQTFRNWWLVKLGIRQENFTTIAMQTGTALEHRILEYIGIKKMDRQIKIRELRLRVNLDGETKETVKEVKTYGKETFVVTKPYWQQAQVEMFATGKSLDIVSYRLTPEDYENWFLPIDEDRLKENQIEYDSRWVYDEYLPRLRYLSQCLKRGAWPCDHYNR